MKPFRLALLLPICAGLAAGQSKPAGQQTTPAAVPGATQQAAAPQQTPPGVEEAVRARVRPFYDAYVDGKFRKAYDVVADESKDAFLTQSKPRYKDFRIVKVAFSDDYTKAVVTTQLDTTFTFYNQVATEHTAVESSWKNVDGQWYWYVPEQSPVTAASVLSSLLGVNQGKRGAAGAAPNAPPAKPSPAPTAAPPGIAPGISFPPVAPFGPGTDPTLLARQLLTQVQLDKQAIQLHADRPDTAVVHVKNSMVGKAQITLLGDVVPGLTVKPDKTEIGPNDSATISIAWNPPTEHTVRRTIRFRVVVAPTRVLLSFTVAFQ